MGRGAKDGGVDKPREHISHTQASHTVSEIVFPFDFDELEAEFFAECKRMAEEKKREEIKKTCAEFEKTGKQFFGMGEVCRRLGISPSTLKTRMLYGDIPDVEMRGPSNARLFTVSDIERIMDAFRTTMAVTVKDILGKDQGTDNAKPKTD